MEAGERFEALGRFFLLAHGDPSICDEDVGVFACLLRDRGLGEAAGARSCCCGVVDDIPHSGRNFVARGCGDGNVDAEFYGGDGQVEENVIGVTYPGNLEALEAE